MSGIKKAVKKVWRPIEKIKSKAMNVATLGLWNKTKKIRHKIVKSKVFRIALGAATIYFGGAALMAMAGGGTASAGIGSAWAGAKAAGGALAKGQIGGAMSALGSGFTGGAGVTGGFTAGMNATAGAIEAKAAAAATAGAGAGAGNVVNTGLGTSGTAPTSAQLMNTASTGLMEGVGSAGLSGGNLVAGAGNTASLAGGAGSTAGGGGLLSKAGGLASSAWGGLGEAGKAAVVTGGVNMAGQMMQGHAEQKAAEQERKRRTYWGVDGEGNTAAGSENFAGLLNPGGAQPASAVSSGFQPWQAPQTLDDLIKATKQQNGWG